MNCISEILKKLKDSHSIYEMANVSKYDTKLPYDLWIDSAGKNRKVCHNSPRLKVDVDGVRIPVSIEENPRILVKNKKIKNFHNISNWIIKYQIILMKHWNKEITDKEALNSLGE